MALVVRRWRTNLLLNGKIWYNSARVRESIWSQGVHQLRPLLAGRGFMSIVIVVKVSEGLVLGADSAATLTGKIRGPGDTVFDGVLQTFYNAKKLMQIGDFPIGVLNWGHAFIGSRTLESHIRQWEHNEHWRSREEYLKHHEGPFGVKDCTEGLLKHLTAVYAEELKDMKEKPQIGVIVAGYSQRDFFPEVWRFVIPVDSEVHNQRPDKGGKPDFGASWFGVTEPIVRLHFGCDDRVPHLISERFSISEDEVRDTLRQLQYPIAFDPMPLQDAIDYAGYMLNVAIGRYRFVLGPELCGGEIEIAVITQNEFRWVSQKSWKLG